MNALREIVSAMTSAEEYEALSLSEPDFYRECPYFSPKNAEVMRAHVRYIVANMGVGVLYVCFTRTLRTDDIHLIAVFMEHININAYFVGHYWMLSRIIENGIMDVLTFLLDNGLMVDFGFGENVTILSVALREKQRDVVDLLLLRGAKLKGEMGIRCLCEAIQHCGVEFLDCLIMYGADVLYPSSCLAFNLAFRACKRADDTIIKRLADMGLSFHGNNCIGRYLEVKLVYQEKTLEDCKETLQVLRAAGADEPDFRSIRIPHVPRAVLERFVREN